MIEKIGLLSGTATQTELFLAEKINALTDAVNSLRDDCNLLMGYIAPENKCEPTETPTNSKMENVAENGKCAKNAQVDEIEQAEKWIGKLCWFSQIYECHQHIAILKRISESGLYVTDDGELYYAYCEPVKPDDDIIYKGGDNE